MTRRIDWTRVINDIQNSDRDMSIRDIAHRVGVHKSTIVRLRISTGEPKYHTGEALIALWINKTNLPKTNLPTLTNR